MATRNIDIGHKQTLRLFEHVGHRMLEQRQDRLTRTDASAARLAHGTGPLQSEPAVSSREMPAAEAASKQQPRGRRMSSEFPRVHPSLRQVLSEFEGESELDVPTFIRRQSPLR